MRFMVRMAVLFYVTTILFLGCWLLLFVLNWVRLQEISTFLNLVYSHPQLRLIVGVIALAVLFINFLFWRAIVGEQQRGKTIAFDNPSGRVSVSLSALEDLVRRVISRVPEVRDVRSAISASKKGLLIEAMLTLNTDVNIPEMTSRLQETVKKRIQAMIGIEEEITVRVHVVKIVPDRLKEKAGKDERSSEDDSEPRIPFHGYRP